MTFVRNNFFKTMLAATLVIGGAASAVVVEGAIDAVQGTNVAEAKTLPSTSGIWKASGAKWWYSYTNGGYARDGWQRIGATWYHFDSAGWMQTGWLQEGGAWYYLKGSGAMATGWQNVGNTWYYLNGSGVMQTGWRQISGTWYYLKPSGAMATGWQNIGNTWYLFDTSGAMKTGWQKVGGAWYYLRSSGAMVANAWVGNYWLGANGAMATNTWVDNNKYFVDVDGLWVPDQTNSSSSSSNNSSNNSTNNGSSNENSANQGSRLVYDYELQVLNPGKLYDGEPIVLYIKTKNPNPDSLEIISADDSSVTMLVTEPYDDVRLESPEGTEACLHKLASGNGYVATISMEDVGVHGLRLVEYHYTTSPSVASSRAFTDTLAHVNINDYDAALSDWMDSMLARYTTAAMTPPEKMEALCEAFDGEDGGIFRFDPIIYLVDPEEAEDPNSADNWRFARLISHAKAFFDAYTWDSLTEPTVMCAFAERIGGFSSIHNCYYDHEIMSEEWQETHYFCKVVYQGEELEFEACPDPDTFVVSPNMNNFPNL